MDGAFEAVERVGFTGGCDGEGLVVLVSANFALCHDGILPEWLVGAQFGPFEFRGVGSMTIQMCCRGGPERFDA